MKKFLSTLLVCFLLSPFMSPSAAGAEIYESPKPLTVHLDGIILNTDVAPYIENGRTMMPLRIAAEALGAQVSWNEATRTVTITKGNNSVIFTADSFTYFDNGVSKQLDTPSYIKEGRSMIPLRAFAEALNVTVTWNQPLQDVAILTGAPVYTPTFSMSSIPDAHQWLLTKYYMPKQSEDSAVGSWMYHWPYDGGLYSEFIFIYPPFNGIHRIVNVSVDQQNNGFVVVHVSDDPIVKENALWQQNCGGVIYAYGPGHGLPMPGGYATFLFNGEELIRTSEKTIEMDGSSTVESLNDPFYRF